MSRVEIHLPRTLMPLFPGLTRMEHVDAATVAEALANLDARVPGLNDRLCEPGPRLRSHIKVFVDREPAELTSVLHDDARIDVIAAISGG
jgi:molybdopterin converting factor small subunit